MAGRTISFADSRCIATGGDQRQYHLLFYQCKNLNLRDIFLYDSAYHSARVIQNSFVKADGLRIYNRVNGNNYGFHFISSQYVAVSNCTVQSQDDACKRKLEPTQLKPSL